MQILQLSQHSVTQHLPQKNGRAARQVEQIFIYPCPYPSLTTTNKTEQNLQDKEEDEKNEQFESQQIGSLICPKLIQKPNSYIVRKYYHRCVVIRKLYCIALFVSIMLSIFYYELDYSKRNDQATVLLYFSTANQIICLFFSLLSVVTENQWMTLEGTSQNSRKYGWLAIAWIIILTQPYPWFESIYITNFSFDLQQQIQYKLNYLLTLLSLLKWWLLIYAMIYFLKSFRIRSSKIWKKYGPSDSYMFSVKCLFKQHSILVILCLFAFLVFFFSFAYRICQRNNRSENNLFQYYGNCIWIVFITMTTVGYGDMSPVTMWGRTFGFLCTFYGVLLVSVMVLVVINTFQMDSSQAETLKIMKRLNEKKEIRIIAGEYIRLALWRLWKNKRLSKIGLYGLMQKQGRKQRNKKNLLRQLIRRSKFNDAHEKNLAVEMNRSFERVSFYVSNLSYNVDSIIGYMSEENLLDLSQMQNRSDLFKTTGFPQKKQ